MPQYPGVPRFMQWVCECMSVREGVVYTSQDGDDTWEGGCIHTGVAESHRQQCSFPCRFMGRGI